ncbi:la-related protein 7 [Nephila pilipes]|uniref:La-related protein 7 n=1 Tax=Nephila pilipes TaxID=299642 RepID=A0A8X6TKF1_NEPPI|nr:la-related protein 7 [Nephila pilipes]
MDTASKDSMIPKPLKGRKKKKLFLKIREQMEFYFSDSNLAKDSFLYNLLEKDPEGYVELENFRSFNKIKELTDDVAIIAEAVSKSNILQVSVDKTKIKRVLPFEEMKDFDACTLYVEKLPPYADQKWIRDVFERFGRVNHINIPHFNISNKIKGFAFVEFGEPESVEKACEYFRISLEKENADSNEEQVEIRSDKTKRNYSSKKDDDGKKLRKRKNSTEVDVTSEKKSNPVKIESYNDISQQQCKEISDNVHEEKLFRKRKLEISESNGYERPFKKSKEPVTEDHEETPEFEKNNAVQSDKQQSIENQSEVDGVGNNSENETADKSKRKRKHRKKNHNHSERPVLRVMPKSEWKVYRNKYLNLQRATMTYLKKEILKETEELKEQENLKQDNDIKKGFHFQPGVIIKITLTESITDPSDIKEQVKAVAQVAYTDASLGHSEMFLRCHTPEEANFVIQEEKLNNLGAVSLLKGSEEESYWKKIEEERKAKFSMRIVRKKRGRDKIVAKAAKLAEQKNKHVYFDD